MSERDCDDYTAEEIESYIDEINPQHKDKFMVPEEEQTLDWFYFGYYAYEKKDYAKWYSVLENNKLFLVRR